MDSHLYLYGAVGLMLVIVLIDALRGWRRRR
jgi:hypothetical protein